MSTLQPGTYKKTKFSVQKNCLQLVWELVTPQDSTQALRLRQLHLLRMSSLICVPCGRQIQ